MLKKILKVSAVLLALLALGGAAYWHFYLRPGLLVESTRYGNMQWLATGVIRYNTQFGRMPRSLNELVTSGALPANSPRYANPMKRGSFENPALSFKDCEFELDFGPAAVDITIPKEVFEQSRYALVRGSWRTWTVKDDVRLFDPKKDGL